MSLTIRKAANGYIVSYMPEYDHSIAMSAIAQPQPSDHVFATSEAMMAFVAQQMVDPCIGVPVEPQTPTPSEGEGHNGVAGQVSKDHAQARKAILNKYSL